MEEKLTQRKNENGILKPIKITLLADEVWLASCLEDNTAPCNLGLIHTNQMKLQIQYIYAILSTTLFFHLLLLYYTEVLFVGMKSLFCCLFIVVLYTPPQSPVTREPRLVNTNHTNSQKASFIGQTLVTTHPVSFTDLSNKG